MKKKILKIVALCVAIVLIVGVCFFANGLVGNPVSKMLATNTAEKYLEENYSDKDFVIESVTYNFKDLKYHANISSPSSVDTHFSLIIDMNGKLFYDNYENDVLSGFNTMRRLDDEYRKMTDKVIESQAFPCELNFGFGTLAPVYDAPSYGIAAEDLVIDGVYNVNELGAKSGKLVLYVYDDTVTVERLAEILLDIKELFDKAGVPFYAVDCELQQQTEGSVSAAEDVRVSDFLYSDIYEDGMTQRVADNMAKTEAKYAESDKELKEGI